LRRATRQKPEILKAESGNQNPARQIENKAGTGNRSGPVFIEYEKKGNEVNRQ